MKTDSIGTIEWANVYGDSGYDIGFCVQQTTDSGYIVTGCYESNIYYSSRSLWLHKTDKAGNTVWTKIFGEDNSTKYSHSVCETYDNGYIITGCSWGLAEFWSTLWIIKTNSLGDTLWSYSSYDYGSGNCVQQTSENDYIVVGTAGYNDSHVYLIRIDAFGDILWTKIYGDPGINIRYKWKGYSVQQTLDGGFIISGTCLSPPTSYSTSDILIIRTNACGDTLWTRTYGGDSSSEIGNSIQKTSDNGYVIVGKTNSFGAGGDDVWLLKFNILDVGVTKIESPTGSFFNGETVTPACSVYNYCSIPVTYQVRMKISDFYDNTIPVFNHAPGTYQYISFPNLTFTEIGNHAISCSTELANDANTANDQQIDSVNVTRSLVWEIMADIPTQPSGKNPKSGSCMAGLDATGLIYFLKASNRPDFYSFIPDTRIGTWAILDTIPKGDKAMGDGKYPKRGAAMAAYEPGKRVYVLRGNNRVGFWKYQANNLGDTMPGWYKLANIPEGAKRPKYGTGLVHVTKGGKDYLFCMKGAKTNEFYLYDIETNTWTAVTSPPTGMSGRVGYKKGSCLCYDGSEYAYVLQGYYGSFFCYKVEADSWFELKWYDYKTYRNRDGKKKKPKDGASLVYHDNNVYMLKGGNTNEVWKYDIAMDVWLQMSELWDIPLGTSNKKVKGGGAMIKFGNYLYASKGKNTDEFYCHSLPVNGIALGSVQTKDEGTMENKVETRIFNLSILPNPAIKKAIIRYTLPAAAPVKINLYNATGRLAKSQIISFPTKSGVFMINDLPTGVYILQFNAGENRATRKMVIAE